MKQMIELAKCMIICTDGTVKTHYFKGTMPVLKEMQSIVDGHIEFVRFSPMQSMVVDEEGLIKNKPINKAAMSFLNRNGRDDVIISGNVFVISNKFIN